MAPTKGNDMNINPSHELRQAIASYRQGQSQSRNAKARAMRIIESDHADAMIAKRSGESVKIGDGAHLTLTGGTSAKPADTNYAAIVSDVWAMVDSGEAITSETLARLHRLHTYAAIPAVPGTKVSLTIGK